MWGKRETQATTTDDDNENGFFLGATFRVTGLTVPDVMDDGR